MGYQPQMIEIPTHSPSAPLYFGDEAPDSPFASGLPRLAFAPKKPAKNLTCALTNLVCYIK